MCRVCVIVSWVRIKVDLYIKRSEVRPPSLTCNGAYCDGQSRCGEGRWTREEVRRMEATGQGLSLARVCRRKESIVPPSLMFMHPNDYVRTLYCGTVIVFCLFIPFVLLYGFAGRRDSVGNWEYGKYGQRERASCQTLFQNEVWDSRWLPLQQGGGGLYSLVAAESSTCVANSGYVCARNCSCVCGCTCMGACEFVCVWMNLCSCACAYIRSGLCVVLVSVPYCQSFILSCSSILAVCVL